MAGAALSNNVWLSLSFDSDPYRGNNVWLINGPNIIHNPGRSFPDPREKNNLKKIK